MNDGLDDDGKIQAAPGFRASYIADARDDITQRTIDAARIIMDFSVVRVDRYVDVKRFGGNRAVDHFFIAEGPAVGGDSPFQSVFTAERNEVHEAFFEVGFTAGKLDVEVTDEVLEVEQGLLPIVDGHVVAIIGLPPIFAVTALVVAALNYFAVDRHRHRYVAASPRIDFLRDGVANVVSAESRKFEDIHYSPRNGSKNACPQPL